MIDKIIKATNGFFKRSCIIVLILVGLLLLWMLTVLLWPYLYVRKTYDLGDKYLSCEWVSYSDSCRVVIVSKDGIHRAVIKDSFKGDLMDIYFQRAGVDTVFFPGHNGKEHRPANVVEASNIVFEYSTGTDRIYDKGIKSVRNDYGGFEHLFTGKDLRTLNGRYSHLIVERGNEYESYLPCPKPKKVVWIWPLQNPLIRRYPFSKDSRESGTY